MVRDMGASVSFLKYAALEVSVRDWDWHLLAFVGLKRHQTG